MIKLATIAINTQNPNTLTELWTAFMGTDVDPRVDGITWLKSLNGGPHIAV
ncbi:hypothetical protein [Arthrobacter sp. AQ5-05]|uniref:hypothetical protein n=1 Tax=Arthrobacter sp. AQ5-05 TaxID=2184581 RepID=UPI0012FBD07D|nr:hypothetical protein [Arthrobacter sp. AQ5-05]